MLARANAFVVPAEGAEPSARGRVGDEVHERRAVAKLAEEVRLEEGPSGERDLAPEGAVELRGVATRLVDLQRHLARVEDDVALAGGAGGRREQLDHLGAELGGVAGEVELGDALPSALETLASLPRGVAAPLRDRARGRKYVHSATTVGEALREVGPLGREEALVDARPLHPRLRRLHGYPATKKRADRRVERRELLLDGDAEGIDRERRLVRAHLGLPRRERDGAGDAARRTGDAYGAIGRRGERPLVERGAAGEAPRLGAEDADPHAARRARGDLLGPPVAHAQLLAALVDEAYLRVADVGAGT